jgi:hypothetical protein
MLFGGKLNQAIVRLERPHRQWCCGVFLEENNKADAFS